MGKRLSNLTSVKPIKNISAMLVKNMGAQMSAHLPIFVNFLLAAYADSTKKGRKTPNDGTVS